LAILATYSLPIACEKLFSVPTSHYLYGYWPKWIKLS